MAVIASAVVLSAAVTAMAADLKPIHTQKTKDVIITLMSESGQWKPGTNALVVEFAPQ